MPEIEPWNKPNEDGEKPGDICCLRAMGGKCYEHNPKNYKEACFCLGPSQPHVKGTMFVGPGNLRCRGPVVHNEFKTYVPSARGLEAMQSISQDFDALLTKLEAVIETGRELALVRTHLEIACFYARKGEAKQTAGVADTTTGVCGHSYANAFQECPVCFPTAPIRIRGCSDGAALPIDERKTFGEPENYLAKQVGQVREVLTEAALPPFGNEHWEAVLAPGAINCTACSGVFDGSAVKVKNGSDLYHRHCAEAQYSRFLGQS